MVSGHYIAHEYFLTSSFLLPACITAVEMKNETSPTYNPYPNNFENVPALGSICANQNPWLNNTQSLIKIY